MWIWQTIWSKRCPPFKQRTTGKPAGRRLPPDDFSVKLYSWANRCRLAGTPRVAQQPGLFSLHSAPSATPRCVQVWKEYLNCYSVCLRFLHLEVWYFSAVWKPFSLNFELSAVHSKRLKSRQLALLQGGCVIADLCFFLNLWSRSWSHQIWHWQSQLPLDGVLILLNLSCTKMDIIIVLILLNFLMSKDMQ